MGWIKTTLEDTASLLLETPTQRAQRKRGEKAREQMATAEAAAEAARKGKPHPRSPLAKHPLTGHPDDQYGFDAIHNSALGRR